MKIAPTLPALRTAAREKLRALPSVPGPAEIEWTAVVLAESALAAPSKTPAAQEQGWLAARAAAAGILTPELAVILSQVDAKALMPFQELQGENRIRMIGRGLETLTRANRAAGLEDTSKHGFALLGVRTPQEKATLEAALDKTIARVGLEKLRQVADRFELATALGQLGKRDEPTNVVGLAGDRTVALERALIADPKLLQIKLDHEIGHLVDQHLAPTGQQWRSHGKDTPFGKGATVSEYAGLNAHEDFAETHAVLLRDWEKVQADPLLAVHARGDVGRKMAWILSHAYGIEVGETPAAVAETLRRVDAGESPYGWRDAAGTLHGAREGYLQALSNEDPWVKEALREGKFGPAAVPSEDEAFDHLMTTRRLEHDPAQDWKIIGAGQATAREALDEDLRSGGEELLARLRERVATLGPSERDRMGYRLDRAWAAARLRD